MKTYKEVFSELKKENKGALVAFIVAGDPDYETSLKISKAICDAGADILEIGLPFSDPIADGKTIQAADIRALASGMNTDVFFDFVRDIRKHTDIPIGVLSYYNLIYQRGIEKFCIDSKKAGINSILIADMTIEESDSMTLNAKKHSIETVFMITPLTNDSRIKEISSRSNGFIYLVSRLGVTGARDDLGKSTLSLIKRVRKFTSKPLCVGFGISTPSHVKDVINAGADGAIVGSAIVKIIEDNLGNKKKMVEKVGEFVKDLKSKSKN